MRKLIKSWLLFGLAGGLLASCSQDSKEPNSSAELSAERVTLSLSAEISIDDSEARAIDYRLGTNSKGQLVPIPQFADKQEIQVHTVLKSSRGTVVAKTLMWKYNAASKKLVLSPTSTDIAQDTNNIVVSAFNNDGGVKWYISGLIGGTLNGTKVTFRGTRKLQGASNAGDAVGNLDVPYAFAWTELIINTQDVSNTRESNGSYKYAVVPSTANVKFLPQGSLIAYKLGTNQASGDYTFTPSGFTVTSNAFGDKGTFELNTNVPTPAAPEAALPSWTEDTPSAAIVYSFASGQEPGTLEHGSTPSKAYYAWVMLHKSQPRAVNTRVMIKGESSRLSTSTYRDFTKTWFTDYQVKGSTLSSGRVHDLRANVVSPLLLPIQYVTDHNLAGGEGLTHVTDNIYPQPVGVTGVLRFADSHLNDASGYYSFYKVAGYHHSTYNPQTKNLQTAIDETFGADKYYVPSIDQWSGVYPSTRYSWLGTQSLDQSEEMAFGPGHDLIRQSYLSDYSQGFSTNDTSQDAYIYAIRFKKSPSASGPVENNTYIYPAAPDNSLKCAYRFRRVGGSSNWYVYNNENLNNQLIIDVVYLGEESVPTKLADISNSRWWEIKKNDGLVISKTFPATGYISDTDALSGSLIERGYLGYYWSSSAMQSASWYLNMGPMNLHDFSAWKKENSLSIRLFHRNP